MATTPPTPGDSPTDPAPVTPTDPIPPSPTDPVLNPGGDPFVEGP